MLYFSRREYWNKCFLCEHKDSLTPVLLRKPSAEHGSSPQYPDFPSKLLNKQQGPENLTAKTTPPRGTPPQQEVLSMLHHEFLYQFLLHLFFHTSLMKCFNTQMEKEYAQVSPGKNAGTPPKLFLQAENGFSNIIWHSANPCWSTWVNTWAFCSFCGIPWSECRTHWAGIWDFNLTPYFNQDLSLSSLGINLHSRKKTASCYPFQIPIKGGTRKKKNQHLSPVFPSPWRRVCPFKNMDWETHRNLQDEQELWTLQQQQRTLISPCCP